MEIETHFETRKEYILTGNELASLDEKHKRDKAAAEKTKKELETKMSSMIPTGNNVASKSGETPMYVPVRHSTKENDISNSKFDASNFNHNKGINPEEAASLAKPLKKMNITESKTINSNVINNNSGNYFKNNKL